MHKQTRQLRDIVSQYKNNVEVCIEECSRIRKISGTADQQQ